MNSILGGFLRVNVWLPLRKNAVLAKAAAGGCDVLFVCFFPDVECEKSSRLTFFFFLFCFHLLAVLVGLCHDSKWRTEPD